MPLRAMLLFTCCLGLAPQTVVAEQLAIITGTAHDLTTGAPLYTEIHRVKLREDDSIAEHLTEYRNPQGQLICNKWLDYSRHPFAPAFELTDLRDGHQEGAEHTAEGYRLYTRAREGDETNSATVKLSDDLVSDSGFDLFVRSRMAGLLKGKRQPFRMAVATELTSFGFEAELVEKTELFGRQAIRIRVQPSTLLRLVVTPLYITYDVENGELLRYEGLTNIRDAQGERHRARIDFPPDKQQYAGVPQR